MSGTAPALVNRGNASKPRSGGARAPSATLQPEPGTSPTGTALTIVATIRIRARRGARRFSDGARRRRDGPSPSSRRSARVRTLFPLGRAPQARGVGRGLPRLREQLRRHARRAPRRPAARRGQGGPPCLLGVQRLPARKRGAAPERLPADQSISEGAQPRAAVRRLLSGQPAQVRSPDQAGGGDPRRHRGVSRSRVPGACRPDTDGGLPTHQGTRGSEGSLAPLRERLKPEPEPNVVAAAFHVLLAAIPVFLLSPVLLPRCS